MLARQTQIGIQNPVFRLGVADVSQEFRVQTLSGKVRPATKIKSTKLRHKIGDALCLASFPVMAKPCRAGSTNKVNRRWYESSERLLTGR